MMFQPRFDFDTNASNHILNHTGAEVIIQKCSLFIHFLKLNPGPDVPLDLFVLVIVTRLCPHVCGTVVQLTPINKTALRCCLKSLCDKPLLPLIGFAYGQSRILIPLPCHCLNPTPLLLLRFKISNPPYALNSAVLLFSFHFFFSKPIQHSSVSQKGSWASRGSALHFEGTVQLPRLSIKGEGSGEGAG